MKQVKLNTTKDKLVNHFILIFSGYFKLTDLEQKLLASIIRYYLSLSNKISDQELVNRNFLDSTHRSTLLDEFTIKQPQLTKYIHSLINKKALIEQEGTISINDKFIPSDKILFDFKITD